MKRLVMGAVLVALLMMFGVTLAQPGGEIILVPFTDETFGIQGVVPEGWRTAAPGVVSRNNGPADPTSLIQQAAPATADAILDSLLPRLLLEERPPVAGAVEGVLNWTLYVVEVQVSELTIMVDMALSEVEGTTYLLLLQTVESDYEALHESVFLPALNAFAPLGAEAAATEAAPEEVPYIQEDVTFTNGDITLAGTLTLPDVDGPHPAVVLVSGSGQQDRDEDMGMIIPGYLPFRDLADGLTRAGIAVLRYDDRGVGDSTGDPTTDTTADFATDAAAAVEYLTTRGDIDPAQIGVAGHSEGGMIAAMLGANNPDVAFIITLAGPALGGREISLFQNDVALEAAGISGEAKTALLEQTGQMFDLVAAGDLEAARTLLETLTLATLQAMPADQQAFLGDLETAARTQADAQFAALSSPWFQHWLAYDPAEDWVKITKPVLAIFGTLDKQVDAASNIPALMTVLNEAGNEDYNIISILEMNHIFQVAVTGDFSEYASLPGELHPDLMPTLVEWLLAHVTLAG